MDRSLQAVSFFDASIKDIEGKMKEPQNCWDFWRCPKSSKERCLIYRRKYGKRCWFLAGCSPQADREFADCWLCPWYLEVTTRCFLRQKFFDQIEKKDPGI